MQKAQGWGTRTTFSNIETERLPTTSVVGTDGPFLRNFQTPGDPPNGPRIVFRARFNSYRESAVMHARSLSVSAVNFASAHDSSYYRHAKILGQGDDVALSVRWRYKIDRWRSQFAAMFHSEPKPLRPRLCPACGTLVGATATKCHACGANMTIVSGRGRNNPSARYGCPRNALQGVCENSLRVRRSVLERALLQKLQSEVLRPEVIEYALERFEKELVAAIDRWIYRQRNLQVCAP